MSDTLPQESTAAPSPASSPQEPISFESFIQIVEKTLDDAQQLDDKQPDQRMPYQHRYAALELLRGLETQITQHINQSKENIELLQSRLGEVQYRIGVDLYETDEWTSAEQKLSQAVEQLSGLSLDDDRTLCAIIDANNYLGMIWFNRSDTERSEKHFTAAERLFDTHGKPAECSVELEAIHLQTTFYLSQLYGSMATSEKMHLSAKYCFLTMHRQYKLSQHKTDAETQRKARHKQPFDALEWVKNCASLVKYYVNYDEFALAQHCYLAAKHVMNTIDRSGRDRDQLEQQCAEIELAWANINHSKLVYSKDWLKKNPSAPLEEPIPIVPQEGVFRIDFGDLFTELDMTLKPQFVARTFEEALPLFKEARRSYETALKFYTLDGWVTEHIDYLRLLSQLYYLLATTYEKNWERRIAMHERRVQLIEKESLLKELNPSVYLDLLQVLSFELGETYVEMYDIAHEQAAAIAPKTDVSLNRQIQSHAKKAIQTFTYFLSLFMVTDDKGAQAAAAGQPASTPKFKIDTENQPAFVRAGLHIARLYYGLDSGGNLEWQRENLVRSLNMYEQMLKHVKEQCGDKAPPGIPEEELTVCRQFVQLIPLKIKELMLRRSLEAK